MQIGTEFSFSAAHRLTFHKGNCKNLHGHNWRGEISITTKEFKDLVLDFGEIKDIIKMMLDHKILVFKKDTTLLNLVSNNFLYISLPFETTVENLAEYIQEILSITYNIDKKCISIKLYETDKSWAKV
jgi:6-pyruvoyltetrahydropterin/6-carboxytetrahydropterin synthase